MLAYGQLAASSAGQRLARGASGNALQGMCQGGQRGASRLTPGAGTSGSRVAGGGRTRVVEKAV